MPSDVHTPATCRGRGPAKLVSLPARQTQDTRKALRRPIPQRPRPSRGGPAHPAAALPIPACQKSCSMTRLYPAFPKHRANCRRDDAPLFPCSRFTGSQSRSANCTGSGHKHRSNGSALGTRRPEWPLRDCSLRRLLAQEAASLGPLSCHTGAIFLFRRDNSFWLLCPWGRAGSQETPQEGSGLPGQS